MKEVSWISYGHIVRVKKYHLQKCTTGDNTRVFTMSLNCSFFSSWLSLSKSSPYTCHLALWGYLLIQQLQLCPCQQGLTFFKRIDAHWMCICRSSSSLSPDRSGGLIHSMWLLEHERHRFKGVRYTDFVPLCIACTWRTRQIRDNSVWTENQDWPQKPSSHHDILEMTSSLCVLD